MIELDDSFRAAPEYLRLHAGGVMIDEVLRELATEARDGEVTLTERSDVARRLSLLDTPEVLQVLMHQAVVHRKSSLALAALRLHGSRQVRYWTTPEARESIDRLRLVDEDTAAELMECAGLDPPTVRRIHPTRWLTFGGRPPGLSESPPRLAEALRVGPVPSASTKDSSFTRALSLSEFVARSGQAAVRSAVAAAQRFPTRFDLVWRQMNRARARLGSAACARLGAAIASAPQSASTAWAALRGAFLSEIGSASSRATQAPGAADPVTTLWPSRQTVATTFSVSRGPSAPALLWTSVAGDVPFAWVADEEFRGGVCAASGVRGEFVALPTGCASVLGMLCELHELRGE